MVTALLFSRGVETARHRHQTAALVEVHRHQVRHEPAAPLAATEPASQIAAPDALVAGDRGREGRDPVVDEEQGAVGTAAEARAAELARLRGAQGRVLGEGEAVEAGYERGRAQIREERVPQRTERPASEIGIVADRPRVGLDQQAGRGD